MPTTATGQVGHRPSLEELEHASRIGALNLPGIIATVIALVAILLRWILIGLDGIPFLLTILSSVVALIGLFKAPRGYPTAALILDFIVLCSFSPGLIWAAVIIGVIGILITGKNS